MSQDTKLNFQRFELAGRSEQPFIFEGKLLGHGSSRADTHTHHPQRSAEKRERCSACRWFSADIYVTDQGRYVVHTIGDSSVYGEKRFSRVSETSSALEIVELLTVRRPNEKPFMTSQSARALAQAASVDDDIYEAYVNRAVV